jgi:hypothetical protein
MPKAVAEARLFLSEFGEIVHEAQLISETAVGCDVCVWMWLVEVNVLSADPRIA